MPCSLAAQPVGDDVSPGRRFKMQALRGKRIAFVGVGLMGGILLERLLDARACEPHQVIVCDPSDSRRAELEERYGVSAVADNGRAALADILILSVPPAAVLPVLGEIAHQLAPGQLLISTAAAVPLSALEGTAGPGVAVVRALPNPPSLVGAGVMLVVRGRSVTGAVRALADAILSCWGEAVEIPEDVINVCAAVTTAMPAYVESAILALTDAGVRAGLARHVALRVAANTVQGSAALVLRSERPPRVVADATPLQPVRAQRMQSLILEAVDVARARMDALQASLGF